MKRRGFLGLLASAAGAFALDRERLLWVPGARTISIAAPRALAPAFVPAFIPTARIELMTPEAYARWMLAMMQSEPGLFARQLQSDYDAVFADDCRPRIGEVLHVRRPLRFAGLR